MMSKAQEEAAWPPAPEMIFASNVEVIDIRPEVEVINDEALRRISIFDETTEQWRDFDYPANAERIYHPRVRPDGMIVISFIQYASEHRERSTEYLLLNPVTGDYSSLEFVCDGQPQGVPLPETWRYYYNPADGQPYLCSIETGELRGPLPDHAQWANEFGYGNRPALSPDGQWLVLMNVSFDVYSYNLATDNLLSLGEIPYNQWGISAPYVSNWVSNTQAAIYYSTGPESIPDDFYVFDVTQEGSLQFAERGWVYTFYEDPSRYEYVMTDEFFRDKTGSAPTEHIDCSFMLYDAQGLRTYELGYDCGAWAYEPMAQCLSVFRYRSDSIDRDGYLYLRFDSNPAQTSTLVHIDLETDEFSELAIGEIESVISVSPDGRYVALILDDNGQIDRVDQGCGWFNWDELENARLAIFDTFGRQYIYETARLGGRGVSVFWFNSADGTGRIFLFQNGYTLGSGTHFDGLNGFNILEPSMHIINLSESGGVVTQVQSFYGREYSTEAVISVNHHYILFRTPQFDVFDIATGERTSIVRDSVSDAYTVYVPFPVEQGSDNSLNIGVSPTDSELSREQYPVIYSIHLPD